MNPFDQTIHFKYLFNITTEKAILDKTANFVRNATKFCEEKKTKFVEECNGDHGTFLKPINHTKI